MSLTSDLDAVILAGVILGGLVCLAAIAVVGEWMCYRILEKKISGRTVEMDLVQLAGQITPEGKCRIVRIGGLGNNLVGGVVLVDWEFAQEPDIPRLAYTAEGKALFHGYTMPELREIHARRAEWN